MNTAAGEISQANLTSEIDSSDSALGGRPSRRRGIQSIKRAVLLAVAVAAATVAMQPSTTLADVSDGSGYAMETVYCNSITHRIAITTSSMGIQSNQIGGSDLFPRYVNYRVWLKMQEYVGGAWRALPWVAVTDGVHQIQYSERAGATTYWYFTWAFETASGIDYRSEWAGGYGPYGWYSDQRGYHSLTSCRS